MPQIPVYNGPQVRTNELRTVNQQAPDVGSGLRAVGQGLGAVGDAVDKIVQRDVEAEANRIDTEVTAGWLQWDAENRRKYQGQNVGEYEAKATEWWDKARETYAQAGSALARQQIGLALGRKRNQALGSVLGHVNAERERFADQSAEAAAQSSIEFGVDTGDTTGAAARVRQIAASTGARKGWTTEMVQSEQQRLLGTLHLTAITKMVEGDPAKARAYYEANKGEIPATAQARVEQVLKAEGDNQFATQFAAKHAGLPLSEQLAKAGEISDPEKREKALLQVRNNHALVKQAEQEREAAASDRAWQMVGKGQRVPESVLMQMNGKERVQLQDHLRDRAKQAATGTPVKTDWAVYEDLRTRLAAGEKVTLAAYSTKLASGEMEKLIDFKTKREDPKKAPEVATAEQQLGAAVSALDLKGENAGKFKAAAQDLYNEHLKRTGKEPTFEERQKINDALAMDHVTHKGVLWDSKEVGYKLPTDARRAMTNDPFTAGKVYVDKNGARAKYLGAGKWEPVK